MSAYRVMLHHLFYDKCFLSDPSPIIGNLCHKLCQSLTLCRLLDLIDITLACEDANSKLVEVVTVDDIDDEDSVGNSLLQCRFGS